MGAIKHVKHVFFHPFEADVAHSENRAVDGSKNVHSPPLFIPVN